MPDSKVFFAYPGDINSQTGGYRYDRYLIAQLKALGNLDVETLPLPLDSVSPDQDSLAKVDRLFAALPDRAIVIIDGLAFGVLDAVAEKESERLRIIALCHHPLALETGLANADKKRLYTSEKRALEFAVATVVTSHNTRQVLIDQFGIPPEKITTALPGTEKVTFSACDGDPIRLLTVATLTQRKGHDILLQSLAGLKTLNWQARFVGGDHFDPDWTATLKTMAEQLDLTTRVDFTGSVADTQIEYQQADVFVLPSRFEGYGMVFAEALSAGLPVVAARAGAVPQVVPESAGLLVPVDNTKALGEALRQFLTDDLLRKQLQRGAREAAASLPSWADAAEIVAQVIQKVRQP